MAQLPPHIEQALHGLEAEGYTPRLAKAGDKNTSVHYLAVLEGDDFRRFTRNHNNATPFIAKFMGLSVVNKRYLKEIKKHVQVTVHGR